MLKVVFVGQVRSGAFVMVLRGLIVALFALLAPTDLPAGEVRSRSILILHQSELRGPFYYQIFDAFRAEVEAKHLPQTTIYAESFDLSRFGGDAYDAVLRQFLREKYRDKPIGVIVAVGSATLERVLDWRTELWPGIPVVFTLVERSDFERLTPSPDVTGNVVQVRLADAIAAARAVVPDLSAVALVGGSWDRQVVFGNWKDEIETAAAGLKVIDMVGLSMDETRNRVTALPDHSAIVYSATYTDNEGNFYPPATALSLIAAKANRPIVVASETFLTSGGIGGYVLLPNVLGADAARLALGVLNGEPPSGMPGKVAEAVRPVFNWKQMQRWRVHETDLPQGSEVRFRDATFWEAYRWQSVAVVAVFLIQTALISILMHERKQRSYAELEAHQRLAELAHVGRRATAGELSSSIAHELNQPLGAILTNAETAELILESPAPDLTELKDIVADIRRDDERASEIIHRMRSFLKRTPFELRDVNLNDIMREAFDFLTAQATSSNVALYFNAFPEALPIKGDPVQLQQVILNLVVNSIEAMSAMPCGRAVIGRIELNGGSSVIVSISDFGPGIPLKRSNEIFDPFFTTKKQGMGMGLSIARTIIQVHKGRIWAENQAEGGAVFRLSLPLASH